ncbi:MAG: hypothetical protein WC313_07005 [Candidatus Kapaibacterium sp.]|jgi:hypothetical protein
MRILVIFGLICCTVLSACSDKLRSLDDKAIEVSSVNGEEISYSRKITNSGIQFNIATGGLGDIRYLSIRSSKNGVLIAKIDDDIEGIVLETLISDLNNNSKPEILLFLMQDAYNSNLTISGYEYDGKSFTRFDLPELEGDIAYGYYGKDHFYISGNMLIREFPVNAVDTDSKRKVSYSLDKNLALKLHKVEELRN